MLLAVNVGNTNTVLGVFQGDDLPTSQLSGVFDSVREPRRFGPFQAIDESSGLNAQRIDECHIAGEELLARGRR